jgi:hypothetical protein
MNKMKIAILSSILMFLLTFNAIPSLSAEQGLGDGRISLIQGQAFIQAKEEEGWTEASVNFPVVDGDRIITEREGRVELQLQNGTYLRVGEISQLDIIALGFDRGKPFIHLNQLEGRIYVNHRPITGEDSSLYIDLPYGVLSSYVPSRFKVDLTSSEARIFVLEGSVEFKSNGRPIPLTQGKTLIAKEGGFAEVGQLYGRDEWDRWNEARDRELLQRQYAQKYLPPELEPYGYDLEGNGRWVYTPEYQYVWVPTVVVGWSPFQYGYWAWKSGIYCWVPREPWGWVPFHYGRWVSTPNHGWAWVPPPRQGIIWNPGAVAWNISSSHVSWVPLAPGEIYYGRRDYGPQSVNINQVNINIQKNVYKNARVKDAVVTVPKDSFYRKNLAKVTQAENPFLKPVKVSGPPIEKPGFSDGKMIAPRFVKESVGKVQVEKKPPAKDLGKDVSSIERSPKVIEKKGITGNPDKRTINESPWNQVEKVEGLKEQTNFPQGNLVKKATPPVLPREKANPVRNSSRCDSKPSEALNTTGIILKSNPSAEQRGNISNGVKGENKVPDPGEKISKNAPIVLPVTTKITSEKEPKYSQSSSERNASQTINQDRSGKIKKSSSNKESVGQRNLISLPPKDSAAVKSLNPVAQSPQRNASANANQNRIERAGQPNSFTSLPTRQEGKASAERASLPEVRSSPAPTTTGQTNPFNRGSTGGILGSSPLGSFR